MFKRLLLLLSFFLINSSEILSQYHQNFQLENSLYSHWSAIRDVAVSGDFAFVTTEYSGLQVMDLTDPADPQPVASWDANPTRAISVTLDGNYAYVSDYEYGFSIIDISDPLNLFETGRSVPRAYITCMTVNGSYLFAAAHYGDEGGMYIYDISDPEDPAEVAYCAESYHAYWIAIVDTFAYVSGWNYLDETGGLFTYNVSDPTSPEYINTVDFDGFERKFIPLGDIAYLDVNSREVTGFYILDISERVNPELIRVFETGHGFVGSLMVEGEFLYLSDNDENSGRNVAIYNISNAEQPEEVSRLHEDIGCGRMAVYNGYVYMGNESELSILDFTDFNTPEYTGGYSNTGKSIEGIAVSDEFAYVTTSDYALRVLDISNRLEPEQVASYDGLGHRNMVIHGDRIYTNAGGGLGVIDISEPDNPVSSGMFFIPGFG